MTTAVERLYRCLLALPRDPSRLGPALTLAVELAKADVVHVELLGHEARYCHVHHAAKPVQVTSIPPCIFTETIVSATTIETQSAASDPRFRDDPTIQQHAIGAVLCAPIGGEFPVGAIYLQSQRTFSPLDRERVEDFALQLAAVSRELCRGARMTLREEVESLEERLVSEALRQSDGNVSDAARHLGVGRAFVYRVLRRRGSVSGSNTTVSEQTTLYRNRAIRS